MPVLMYIFFKPNVLILRFPDSALRVKGHSHSVSKARSLLFSLSELEQANHAMWRVALFLNDLYMPPPLPHQTQDFSPSILGKFLTKHTPVTLGDSPKFSWDRTAKALPWERSKISPTTDPINFWDRVERDVAQKALKLQHKTQVKYQ